MTASMGRRFAVALTLCGVVVAGAVSPAAADEPAFEVEFPAGQACDFTLHIAGFGDGQQVYREFTDRDGNVVRTLGAGTGYALDYTNVDTGAGFSTKANGSVTRTTLHDDGTQTTVLTGHNVVILFPGDVPPGPSTTLYAGRVVLSVDAAGSFTVQHATGRKTDICALLSS